MDDERVEDIVKPEESVHNPIQDVFCPDEPADEACEWKFISEKYREKWSPVPVNWYNGECVARAIAKVKTEYGNYNTRFGGKLYYTYNERNERKDHYTIVISGGNNGSGLWRNYIDQIRDFFHEVERYFSKVWLIELGNDCCDDVFTLVIGCKR